MAGGLWTFVSSPESTVSKLLFQTITCRDQQAHRLREKSRQPFAEKMGLKAVPRARGQWRDSGPPRHPKPTPGPAPLSRRAGFLDGP